jgi:ABC-type polysaccharide/polyol phosphate export permease
VAHFLKNSQADDRIIISAFPPFGMSSTNSSSFSLAVSDVWRGIKSIYIWPMLGWQDIKQRYRRSMIGPFWLTISYGAMIFAMGPLYGRLLQQDISVYFPYLAVSFVVWTMLSGIIIDSCNAFVGAEGYIKEVKLPLTVHVLRVVWKNVLICAHNFVIVVIVMIFYPPQLSWSILLIPVGIFMIAVNGVWVGILFGLFCARFRDLTQVVSSVVQIAFFLTPVMWRPNMLGSKEWIVGLNPLTHFLQVVRAPLLDGGVPIVSWYAVIAIAVIGFPVTLLFFSRYRSRVAYWV